MWNLRNRFTLFRKLQVWTEALWATIRLWELRLLLLLGSIGKVDNLGQTPAKLLQHLHKIIITMILVETAEPSMKCLFDSPSIIWFSISCLVLNLINDSQSPIWFPISLLVPNLLIGSQSFNWFSISYLVLNHLFGAQSLIWFSISCLVLNLLPVPGSQSPFWFSISYLVINLLPGDQSLI